MTRWKKGLELAGIDIATSISWSCLQPVNKSGGSRSKALYRISAEIVSWSESQSIAINVVYLPGS
jgi:hypothetical protein